MSHASHDEPPGTDRRSCCDSEVWKEHERHCLYWEGSCQCAGCGTWFNSRTIETFLNCYRCGGVLVRAKDVEAKRDQFLATVREAGAI